MFPTSRGGPGAGRGLLLLVLALLVGTGLLLATGDRPEAGATRLEVTQATAAPVPFHGDGPSESNDRAVVPTVPPPGGAAGAPERVTSTTAPASAAPATELASGGLPAPVAVSGGGTSTTASTQRAQAPGTESAAPAPTATTLAASAGDSPTTTTPPTTTPVPVTRAAEAVTTTTTPPTTTPARSGPSRAPSAEAEVVPLTNRDRSGAGLGSLTRSACLDSVASRYAEQMARSGVLAHNPGAGPAVIGCQPGATWGDNVGTSAPCDTALLEREWMASPGHRKNILTGAFRQIGVGAWADESGGCWVQVLFSS